jgi:hypothetical protein
MVAFLTSPLRLDLKKKKKGTEAISFFVLADAS